MHTVLVQGTVSYITKPTESSEGRSDRDPYSTRKDLTENTVHV